MLRLSVGLEAATDLLADMTGACKPLESVITHRGGGSRQARP